ncbi:MAG: hypothetical protein L0Y56_11875 [Nitrospira sp.]|nr:hypothetical protein [Nitrospira sp.]
MNSDSPASIAVLYLVSITPRGRRLPLRIVNARKKMVFEDEEYSPFPFLIIPKEDQGKIVNFEVEFPRNRSLLQGFRLYELNEAEVRVSMVREDRPAQILETYSGILDMYMRKMWIGCLRKERHSKSAGILRILRWTSELPTKPGWYWLWEGETPDGEGKPKIVEVAKGQFGLEVHYSGLDLSKPLKTINGQWGGPIQQPEG